MFPEWAIGPFTKYEGNPVLEPQEGTFENFEARDVFNPAVVVKNGRFYLFYRAQDLTVPEHEGKSQIGLAWSDDGYHFQRYERNPVIRATENYELPGGCEDPRIFKFGGVYYMWYTAYHPGRGDHDTDQCQAISRDLIHWEKHGPRGYKNDSILVNSRGEPVRVNGNFILYQDDFIAFSDNFRDWGYKKTRIFRNIPGFREVCYVLEGKDKDKIIVFLFMTAQGRIRNKIEELALATGKYTKESIKNAEPGVICEALISKGDPEKILEITTPILYPSDPWEFEGVKGPGNFFACIFMQSLVKHKGQWWLYYGGADHVVCLATAGS